MTLSSTGAAAEPGAPTPASRVGDRGLSQRASLNALAAGADYAARTAVEILINPLMVSHLGSHLYGAWRVLWRWTGYVWAASGRSVQALQWTIANRQASQDWDEKRQFVGSAAVVWVAFLPLLLLVGGAGAWLAPQLLDIEPEHASAVRWTGALLVADAMAVTLLMIPRAVLQGENLGYKRLGLSTLLIGATGGLTAAALVLGAGIAGVAGAHLAGTILTGLLFWRVTARHVEWFGVARPARAAVRWFFGLSWWFTVWKLVNQLMLSGDVLVLGIFGSVELVAIYTLTKYVPEALTTLFATLFQGAAPGLGGLVGGGKLDRAAQVRAEVLTLVWLATTAAGVAILMWNESFVGLWVGADLYAGDLATLVLVAMVFQLVVVRIDANVIDVTLDVRSKTLLGLVSTVGSLAAAALVVGPLGGGIVGLALAVIGGRLLLTVTYPRLVGRTFGIDLASQVRATLRPLATTVVLFTLAVLLAPGSVAGGWIELVGLSAATFVVGALVAAAVGLTGAGRARIIRRSRAVLAKGRQGAGR